MPLAKGAVRARVLMESASVAMIRFTSRVFQHAVQFELPGLSYSAADNFFDLYPGETKIVTIKLGRKVTPAQLKAKLTFRSLVDTY